MLGPVLAEVLEMLGLRLVAALDPVHLLHTVVLDSNHLHRAEHRIRWPE